MELIDDLDQCVERGGTLTRELTPPGLTVVPVSVVLDGQTFDLEGVRYASVLGRIGLAWMLAALIAMRWEWRGQLGWIAAILLGYWALGIPLGLQATYTYP